MTPGDRFKNWIDGLSLAWKDRLKGWLVEVLALPLEVLMNVIGKAFAPKLRPFIDKLEESGEIPPELQPLLDELKTPTGQIASILGYSLGGAAIGGVTGSFFQIATAKLGYWLGRLWHPLLPSDMQLLMSWLRRNISDDDLKTYLQSLGYDDLAITVLKDLAFMRLDPATVTSLWNRNRELYEPMWKDLADQGFDPARISMLKELANIIPPLADMVRFADFGAFDPEIIEMWREFYDAPGWILEPMAKIGIIGEWANKYWFSHWRQPGRYELGEMHRRGLIDDEIVKKAYLTQGYSTFWQDNLLELVKEVPTRVDVRRFWDMRTIDEARLREIYHAQGYYGKDLDDYVLWTKVYVAFPDLITRWKNGWISEGDVRSELTALGMPAERVEEMMQTKIKAAQPERTEKERDLTKSEIVKGVKKEYITWEQGIDLLVDLGYDPTEAEFILSIWVAVEAGSPETFAEFKELTQKWRKIVAREPVPVQPELKAVADEVVRITRDIEALNRAIKEEEAKLVGEEVLPEAATERLDELRVTLHRAEATLAEARSRYDRQLAIFRHAPPPPGSP